MLKRTNEEGHQTLWGLPRPEITWLVGTVTLCTNSLATDLKSLEGTADAPHGTLGVPHGYCRCDHMYCTTLWTLQICCTGVAHTLYRVTLLFSMNFVQDGGEGANLL